MSLTTPQKDELLKLIRDGQKIVAVKRYREITGVGLQEALYAVSQLVPGAAAFGGAGSSASYRSLPPLPSVDPKKLKEAEAAAMAALRENNAIEAIRRYRQHTHLDLKEAKEAVDVLGVVHRSNGRVNAKLARALMDKVFSGKKDEALTMAMSSAGYDDAEARSLIKAIASMRPGLASCAGGCLRMIIALAILAAFGAFGAKQLGLF
jgi:ribosomal protein L7/L12